MAEASIPNSSATEEGTAEAVRELARRVGGVYGADSKLLFEAADKIEEQARALKRVEEVCRREQHGPGTMGCHEAFHVAGMLADIVEAHLCEHPAITLNPEWRALAKRAADALQLLYQDIGEAHCK